MIKNSDGKGNYKKNKSYDAEYPGLMDSRKETFLRFPHLIESRNFSYQIQEHDSIRLAFSPTGMIKSLIH